MTGTDAPGRQQGHDERGLERSPEWGHVLTRFDAIVERYGDLPAVIEDGRETSYSLLRAKARRVAGHILSQLAGDGPSPRNAPVWNRGATTAGDAAERHAAKTAQDERAWPCVALRIGKSADYIAAMLGCWYAGAAFVPVDPALPEARKEFILNDIKPEFTIDSILKIDDDENVAPYDAGGVAYVIYTSGSTGAPKGVVVTHAGLPNVLRQQIDAFDVRAGDRSLSLLSVSFDASVSDIGCALLSGAALVIETTARADVAADLAGVMARRGITHVDIAPSLLKVLSPADVPPSLRSIIIGGEVCPVETVRKWAGHLRLTNVYGPTEATICTSLGRCGTNWDRPLIGRALDGVIYRVVDEDMRDAESGELLIGGCQLAAGYWGRADLDAAKFVTLDGERFYRTGDRVTRHADGEMSFLGRVDRQVKIRGQLTEPEEVEAVIARHEDVTRAAVVVRRDAAGRANLWCYYSGDAPDAELVLYARRSLPEWMVPQGFTAVTDWPLTASGKIDAARLPLAEAASGAFTPPRSVVERQLFDIWAEVLGHTAFGVETPFFEAGGDSVDIIALSIAAERAGMRISPSAMGEHPSIRMMAAFVEGRANGMQEAGGMAADILRRMAALPADIVDLCRGARGAAQGDAVFFTGATGFLGARLLHDLCHVTNWRFICLVRAETAAQGMARIEKAMAAQSLVLGQEMRRQGRIEVVCGDLEAPRFGLMPAQWDALAARSRMIVHSAAIVNMVRPFAALRAANLEACFDILRLALAHGQMRPVHYLSTLSVFVSADPCAARVYEADDLSSTRVVYGGYAQTKWAAEVAFHTAARLWDSHAEAAQEGGESNGEGRGAAGGGLVTSYRLGLVTGDTRFGFSPARDFLGLFVQGVAQIGAYPQAAPTEDMAIDITPVDYASAVLCALIAGGAEDDVYHIANRKGFTLGDILRGLGRAGVAVRPLPEDAWRAAAEKIGGIAAQGVRMALCRCLGGADYARMRGMDLFQATGVAFDMTRLEAALHGAIPCPAADEALMDLYLARILAPEEQRKRQVTL